MRAAVMVSRMLESGVDPSLSPQERSAVTDARIDFREAFHLATAGGGDALDLPVGRFAPGCHFDALAIDPAAAAGTMRMWDVEVDDDMLLETIVHTASRPNIAGVWVGGAQVA